MRKLFLLASCGFVSLSALVLPGCSFCPGGSYHPKLYTSGSKAKGVVAMLPVFYRSGKSLDVLPWNLQTEFTEEISKRLYASDKVFLIKHNASPQIISQFYAPSVTQFSPESITSFLPAEFIVATEILEQKSSGDVFGHDSITASVRVRVFDIRHNRVSLIYQEIIESTQPIAAAASDYYRYGWPTKHFDATPMGLMHNRLFRDIVGRVEGYICANYS
ncbi:putative exported protein [Chlamydia ibidis]|uniref:Exported protein n=2 Tax=Chlamydia ibidis TaxID=1405396 RepID=A0ABN0MZB1_9CHLA|nr:CT253 family lipoprotein [Chlamydia ibidis]EPP35664.1 putative exported protein [Chlamydia ibidis]EQM62599.1 putative exported protein [Chlamydia ibidis 10-1398/6]